MRPGVEKVYLRCRHGSVAGVPRREADFARLQNPGLSEGESEAGIYSLIASHFRITNYT
jgi:hypothetical protein